MEVRIRQATIVAVGRAGDRWKPLLGDYERRLSRQLRLEVMELKAARLQDGMRAAQTADSDRVLERLDRLARASASPAPSVLIADRGGEALTSEKLADWVGRQTHVVAVVGGAPGLEDEVRQRAAQSVSFGRATFPHELARLMLTEQLYRAMKILRHEPYHH